MHTYIQLYTRIYLRVYLYTRSARICASFKQARLDTGVTLMHYDNDLVPYFRRVCKTA